MERNKRIDHRSHSHEREQPRRDAAYWVTKVQKANGKATEYDGEVEPWEEGPLIGEENFGLDTCGERNSLAYEDWSERLSQWLGDYG